jgi:hypothetical protein
MATGITPFGESFGDPRRYMGQSPMAQIGQALKAYGMIQGLEKSGAIKALDNLGIKADSRGSFTLNRPAGAVPPITSGAAGDMNTNGVFGTNPMPISPSSLSQPVMPVAPVMPAGAGVQITPMGQEAPSNVQFNTLPPPPPPDAGMQLLNGTFRPQSAVDVSNPTDFNPLGPDASNQMAVSPDDYKNAPGYGKLAKAVGMFMGMG